MGLKDNFRQAAKELLPSSEEPVVEKRMEEKPIVEKEAPVETEPVKRPLFGGEPKTGSSIGNNNQRTVIAPGVVVQGTIKGAGGVDIYGDWIGDVAVQEDLKLYGRIEGNVNSREVKVCGGKVRGNLQVVENMDVDRESIIMGNIKANSAALGGKFKGDLTVQGSLQLSSDAVVVGQVTAGQISIAEGAVVQGNVYVTSKDMDQFFQEAEDFFKDIENGPKRSK